MNNDYSVALEHVFTQIELDLISVNWIFSQRTNILILFQAHMLNVCVHELLLVTLIQQQAIDQHKCEDGARTEISSFLNSRSNTNQPWGELEFGLHWKYSNMGTTPSI